MRCSERGEIYYDPVLVLNIVSGVKTSVRVQGQVVTWQQPGGRR